MPATKTTQRAKMNKFRCRMLFVAVVVMAAAGVISAQDIVFSDPAVEYTFQLPQPTWTMVVKPSETIPNVEYVYGDRQDGYLKVRKLKIEKDGVMSDFARNEGEKSVQFLPGYVSGKIENFAGNLRGTVFNFEYTSGGKPMSGRYYYLRAAPTTVFLLAFTCRNDKMNLIQNQTDAIARSFKLR